MEFYGIKWNNMEFLNPYIMEIFFQNPGGAGGKNDKKVITCWVYFMALSPLPLIFSSTNINMHTLTILTPATICKLHLPYLFIYSQSSIAHFSLISAFSLQKLQGNTRTEVQPSCLRSSASCHSSTVKRVSVLNWNMLSTGEKFMCLHLMFFFKTLQST